MERFIISRQVWTNPICFIAFGFGAGLFPFMPGTMGTLIAIPFYLLFCKLAWPFYLAIVMITFLAGIWICDQAETRVAIADYSGIVWDEMVGLWATLFLAPTGWQWLFFGFVLFRLFDILKPWPINWANDKIHGGFGIMFDDLLAGIFACLVLQITNWLGSVYHSTKYFL